MKAAAVALLALVVAAVAGGAGYWYGRERPAVPPAAAEAPAASAAESGGESGKRILYYRNPMGLPDTSPVPKKDWMGMDYIPVYEGEEAADDSTVVVSPARVQKLGVRTEAVELRQLGRTVRAVGVVQFDERRLAVVTTKFDGFVEKLHVSATGQEVKRGQALAEVYAPELVVAQQEYLIGLRNLRDLERAGAEARGAAERLVEGSLAKLRNWDMPADEIARLRRTGEPLRRITVRAPAAGVVLEKRAVEGMRFMAGEPLYRLADLATVWLVADVFEQDLGLVSEGQPAMVTVDAFPGRTFEGAVEFIYPTLARETRTAQVRIVLPNADRSLRAGMFASVELAASLDRKPVVAAPEAAVLNSGARQAVLVEKGEGRYEPREVKLGRKGDGFYEVVEGLTEGERVVVGANFLIDAESNLRAALKGFAEGER